MKKILVVVLSLYSILSFATETIAADKIRVLILTGKNNHNWKKTTPLIEKILTESDLFEVSTTVPPKGLDAENLKNYDVIVSNWNSFGRGSAKAEKWGDGPKKAYLDFVANGKGHVTIHAGGCSFYKGWAEYWNVTQVYWKMGKTRHGPQHRFNVSVVKKDHPITSGMEDFEIVDEMWEQPGIVEGVTVLTTSKSTKKKNAIHTSTVVSKYGKGRCFATTLGHGVKNMAFDGFKQLLIRGTQWAATGKVSVKKTNKK